MKKIIFTTFFIVLMAAPMLASAQFNSKQCYPSIKCSDPAKHAYGKPIDCRPAISSLANCQAINPAYNRFSCEKGCYTVTASPSAPPKAPTCPVVTLSGGTIVPALTWVRDGDIGRIVECTTGMLHTAFNGLRVDGVRGSVMLGSILNEALGTNSVAMGLQTTASGNYSTAAGEQSSAGGRASTAMGYEAMAFGEASTSLGYGNIAQGNYSTALGIYTEANGMASTAIGYDTEAPATASFASGHWTEASGGVSTAMGLRSIASGGISTALGEGTLASGYASTAMGIGTRAQAGDSTAIGRFNLGGGDPLSLPVHLRPNDPLFEIGNGADHFNRSNALTVKKNGDTDIRGQLYIQPSGETDTGLTIYSKDGLIDAQCLDADCRGAFFNANGINVSLVDRNGFGLETNAKVGTSHLNFNSSNPRVSFATAGFPLKILNSSGMQFQNDAGTSTGVTITGTGKVTANPGGTAGVLGGSNYGVYGSTTASSSSNTYAVYATASNSGTGTAYGVYSTSGTNYFANRVGIGTTNPMGNLHVRGNGWPNSFLFVQSEADGQDVGIRFYEGINVRAHIYTDAATNALMVLADTGSASQGIEIRTTGRVGIGFANPNFKLQLPDVATDGGGRGRANAWTTYSDSRVKMNQKNLSYGLKEILALAPKSYDHYSSSFKDGNLKLENESAREIGLIAQEVYKFIPEAVNKPSDESLELWGMDYDKLAPVFINAIKELKSEKDADWAELKAETEALRAEVAELKAEMAELKSLFAN